MSLIKEICGTCDSLIILYTMVLVLKYVYHEDIYVSKKIWLVLSISYLCIYGILEFYKLEEIQVIFLISIFTAIVVIFRKKKRFSGIFLFIPIMGIVTSMWIVISVILALATKKNLSYVYSDEIFSFISSITTLFIIIFYGKLKKYFRENYIGNLNMNFKVFELSSIERNIISLNGIILFFSFVLLVNLHEINFLKPYELLLTILISIFNILILLTLILVITKSISTNYYKSLSSINEHYLEAQLNHFKSYRNSQIKTKRIRHDMKNHLLCICDLYDTGKFEQLGEYIHELNNTVISINKELYIGNDIADAIINEKNEIAKSNGIEIHTEGSLSGIEKILPIDICTIFANALDNCIESLKSSNLKKKMINIYVRKTRNFILISFSNSVGKDIEEFDINQYVTTKVDKENHGFGIENIKTTAKKYNGYTKCAVMDDEYIGRAFVTQVMLKT